jgi:predicted nucleic acid-binding protein
VVATNSSPLIYLAALSDFDLLPRLFGEICMPPAVWREVVEQGSAFLVHDAVRSAVGKWLRVVPLEATAQPIFIRDHLLHLGETEVIQLAQQMRASMIRMDDRLAVTHARPLGFRVSPTVAIYIKARRLGVIKNVKDKVDQLRSVVFHLSERDYRAVLAAAGEASA